MTVSREKGTREKGPDPLQSTVVTPPVPFSSRISIYVVEAWEAWGQVERIPDKFMGWPLYFEAA
jgi:hypothetical protein